MKNNAKYMKKVFLKNKCNKNILFLPDEIIFNILSYLTIKDIFSIRVTCKKLMDLSNFIFPGTIKYMQTIRDYDKLKLIKEIYFVENNIKVEKKSVHINFYEISYEYFSKFKEYNVDFYYEKLIKTKIINIYSNDIYITIFSKYILKDFKDFYEKTTGRKLYPKRFYKYFINNILRIFINSDSWVNLKYLYIVLPLEYVKYKDIDENYNIVKFIDEINLFQKNIIDMKKYLYCFNMIST